MSAPSELQDGRCQWCGRIHLNQRCPLVRAIEYYPDGTTKRIEFLTPADMVALPVSLQTPKLSFDSGSRTTVLSGMNTLSVGDEP